jgi:hypothetical protein
MTRIGKSQAVQRPIPGVPRPVSAVRQSGGTIARPLALALPPAEQYDIAGAIIEAANTLDASVIVLGARGLTGIRAMLGSVSNHVAQHAHRPVLIIPPDAADTAARAAAPASE